MAMPKWGELITIQDWRTALSEILDEVECTIKDEDANKLIELQKVLKEYIKRSPSKCDSLDDMALKAVQDMFLAQREASLKAIVSRNVELKKAAGLLEKITDEVKKDKKELQFENIIEVLEKAEPTVETLKKLEEELDNPDQQVLDKIKTLKDAIKDFKGIANRLK